MDTKQKKSCRASTGSVSPMTTRSTRVKHRATPPGPFKKGMRHPFWGGAKPLGPYKAGTILGSLRVLSRYLLRKNSSLLLKCKCLDCGSVFFPSVYNVKNGATTRCTACGQKKARQTYSQRLWGRTPDAMDLVVRDRWFAIVGRCDDPLNQGYENYGGRGIKLHESFRDPLHFIDYMKELPGADTQKEIGRIDNEKGYEPGNLRWETRAENSANTRRTRKVFWEGMVYSATAWGKKYTKYSSTTVARFLRAGILPTDILARETSGNPSFRPRKRRPKPQVCNG